MRTLSRSWLALMVGLGLGVGSGLAGEPLRESRPGTRRNTNLLHSKTPAAISPLERLGDGPARSAIPSPPVPGGAPPPSRSLELDPKEERRLRQELDRRRHWLLENAARLNAGETGFSNPGRDRRRETARPGVSDNVERLLQATERNSATERSASGQDLDELGPEDSRTGDGERVGGNSPREGDRTDRPGRPDDDPSRAGEVPGFDLPGFTPRGESTAGPDSPRARPEATLFPDASELLTERQKEATTRARDEAFDQVLNEVAPTSGGSDALVSRATAVRRDQFQNLLASPAPLGGPVARAPSL
ncbi:MAG: hypothetical protein ACKO3N_10740, partial [Verrucomicrobiota bacterium]